MNTLLAIVLLDISNAWKTTVMIALMIVVFYFFLIRPQSQKAKEEEKYRKSLTKGDKVMTSGGIHAEIVSTDASYATILVAKDTKIKVLLSSLSPIPTPKK